jgi:hypothetical protein
MNMSLMQTWRSIASRALRQRKALLLLAFSVCSNAPASATDCWLRCESQPECRLANVPRPIPQDRAIIPSESCQRLGKVTDGRVEALLRVKGRVNVLMMALSEDLGVALAKAGTPDCAFTEKPCRERRDLAMLAGRAGKAFDGPAGHKPAGSPCAIGLPCGVVLAPAQGWALRIDEPRAAGGTLQITALRMATGTVDVAVADARTTVPAGFVRAGASYSYALKSAAGEVIAAGQFSAAAAGIEADVRAAEKDALTAGRAAPTARLEALLANDLDWDAMLLTRP